MQQGKLPILTKEQLERFRNFLVEIKYVNTPVRARKVTKSPRKTRQVFFQVLEYIDIKLSESDIYEFLEFFAVVDIFDLYRVDDDQEKANHTHDKSDYSLVLSNHTHDKAPLCFAETLNLTHEKKAVTDSPLSNHTHDNPINLANHTHNKRSVRGKQKLPRKVRVDVMIDKEQHARLGTLQGNISRHIRQAIDLYLKTNFPP